jgi:hypothetical protein
VVSAAIAALLSCGQGDPSVPGTGDGTILDPNKKLHLRGLVVDRATNAPIGSAILAIESGGILQGFPDTTKASPYYRYGGMADAQGNFDIELPPGTIGIHSFADGYVHGRRGPIGDLTAPLVLHLDAIAASVASDAPVVSSFDAVPSTVVPGGQFTLSAVIAAGKAASPDPLSDTVLVVQPATFVGAELDPPTRGDLASGYPDGRYARMFQAPDTPGAYTYYLVTASEFLVTSPRTSVTVTVTAAHR